MGSIPNVNWGIAYLSARGGLWEISAMIRADRVQQRLDDLGLNPFSASRKAELGAGYVRDILRGKILEPGAQKLNQLAAVLKCSPDYLMGLIDSVGAAPGFYRPNQITVVQDLPIMHEVAAGRWLAVDEIRDESYGSFPAALAPEFAAFRQWFERVRGDSMDEILPDGALVHVVDAIEMGYVPRAKDLVVVVRTRAQGAFVERSIKQVHLGRLGVELRPRSRNPIWSDSLSLTEGVRENEDMEVQIVAKVVRGYLDFS